mmetsp:Transcript_14086/g.25668  ORF Transcript_14086/g.25668 Transcript_14086/m.25668 type:complete len:95 (-) Transcript_14086:27-311(-)
MQSWTNKNDKTIQEDMTQSSSPVYHTIIQGGLQKKGTYNWMIQSRSKIDCVTTYDLMTMKHVPIVNDIEYRCEIVEIRSSYQSKTSYSNFEPLS